MGRTVFQRAGLLLPVLLCTQAHADAWSARIQGWQRADVEGLAGATPVARREIALAWHRDWRQGTLGLSYAHQPVLIRTGEPAHNGYFHRVDFHTAMTAGNTRLELNAGLHGSSNMFKHADFHGDAAVFTFAALHRRPGSATGFGVNGDYRFGAFRLYPRLRHSLDLAGAGVLALDLPIAVTWRDGGRRWQAGIERYGEKWGALDATRRVASSFTLSEWRAGASRRWAIGGARYLEIGAGVSFGTRVRSLDLVAGAQNYRLDPAVFVGIGFGME